MLCERSDCMSREMDVKEKKKARKKNHRYHKITIKWNRKHKNTNREEIDIFISAFYDPTWKTLGEWEKTPLLKFNGKIDLNL